MKIDIITLHCPLNYGAILQTYALQTYIQKLGHEVEVINYRPDYIVYDQALSYIPDGFFTKNILLKLIYYIFKIPHKIIRKRLFDNFINRYINITAEYKIYDELEENPPKADRYICGSDQIWGYSNKTYKDPAYFLKFIPNGSICSSYAASGLIPDPLPADMENLIIPLINKLSNISVREFSVAETLKKYIEKPITHVVDPSFLLSKEEWTNLISNNKYQSKKYILLYPVGEWEGCLKIAEFLSKKKGLPVYCITGSQRRDKRIKKFISPDPNTFLSLFLNAEYIITNSFHGIAFSMIFNKQFFVCPTNIASARITSILKEAKCESALINPHDIIHSMENYKYCINPTSNMLNQINNSKTYISDFLS